MSEFVANCPRCGAQKVTFTLLSAVEIAPDGGAQKFELFAACRACRRSTTFVLRQLRKLVGVHRWEAEGVPDAGHNLRDFFDYLGYVSTKDRDGIEPPEHIPEDIRSAFVEGATCLATGCVNAAAAMFRLCIDLATKPMVPDEANGGPNARVRRSLGLRLEWLFEKNKLPVGLRELAECLQQDGNDGAHDGTLGGEDAEDLLDFTFALLERMFTEPRKLELAKERREERRGNRG